MLSLPSPKHMPCSHCGASVERGTDHACEDERLVEFRLFQLRGEVDAFDELWQAWLDSPRGRFELFYAERTRRS